MKRRFRTTGTRNKAVVSKAGLVLLSASMINQYSVNYDVDYSGCNGCDDSICRCSTIGSSKITEGPAISNIVQKICKNLEEKDIILKYCVDRLLRVNGLYDSKHYSLNIEQGYYGEEVAGIDIDSEIIININKDLQNLIDMDDNKRIEYVLTREYGYLLSSLEGATYNVIKIKPERIKIGNEVYAGKIKPEDCEIYNPKTHNLPIGIYRKVTIGEETSYKIVDGYHRYLQFRNEKEVSIIAAVWKKL
jgi:hypothetical protein